MKTKTFRIEFEVRVTETSKRGVGKTPAIARTAMVDIDAESYEDAVDKFGRKLTIACLPVARTSSNRDDASWG